MKLSEGRIVTRQVLIMNDDGDTDGDDDDETTVIRIAAMKIKIIQLIFTKGDDPPEGDSCSL